MGRQENSGGSWWRVAEFAERQHGVVSREQLRAIGMSDAAIDYAVATGRLFPIFRAAFGVGHPQVGSWGRMLAAVFACGSGTVVSHGTAAALLGLWENEPQDIHVVAPIEAGRKIAGIRRRHVPLPMRRETWMRHGIPCTSAARTIVDLAGTNGERALRRTIEQAAVLRLLDVAEIDAILTGPRRRGTPMLRMVIEDWRRYSPKTRLRSRMEAKLLPLLTQRNIPIPQCNEMLEVGLDSFEIDFLWRRQFLVVEADGDRYHDNPAAQSRDRHRNHVLAAAGYRVLRLRWEDLRDRPQATVARLARLLESSGSPVP